MMLWIKLEWLLFLEQGQQLSNIFFPVSTVEILNLKTYKHYLNQINHLNGIKYIFKKLQ